MEDNQITLNTKHFKYIGISLIILGLLAIMTPFIAGSMIVIFLGLIIFLGGVSSIVNTKYSNEKVALTILGLIKIVCGILIILHPIVGLAFFTLLLAFYFIIEGIWKIIMAFQFRVNKVWFWLFLTGIISLILGVLIWMQWPSSSLWIVGFLVGINFVFTGFALTMFSKKINIE